MITTDGKELFVGTGGELVDRSMFFYSQEVNAVVFLEGFDLLEINHFKSIEASMDYSIIGTSINISQSGNNQIQINVIDLDL